jgi:hypothetical protein
MNDEKTKVQASTEKSYSVYNPILKLLATFGILATVGYFFQA